MQDESSTSCSSMQMWLKKLKEYWSIGVDRSWSESIDCHRLTSDKRRRSFGGAELPSENVTPAKRIVTSVSVSRFVSPCTMKVRDVEWVGTRCWRKRKGERKRERRREGGREIVRFTSRHGWIIVNDSHRKPITNDATGDSLGWWKLAVSISRYSSTACLGVRCWLRLSRPGTIAPIAPDSSMPRLRDRETW